jgi:hypothetical protein
MKRILTPLLIIAFTIAPFGVQTTYAVSAPTDYVSCWELDESSTGVGAVTRVDASTTPSNDLTDNNTTASGAGKISNGADFELANTEYLNITDANQVGLDITSDISFSTWYMPESQPALNDAHALFYKWGGSQAAYGLIYADLAGVKNVRLNLYATGGGSNVTYDWRVTATTSAWTHIALYFDATGHASGNGTAELFINSVSLGTRTNTGMTGMSNTTGAFSLSSLGSGIQWYADGIMDVAEIYNRLLTSAEITALYNSGNGTACAGRAVVATTPIPTFNRVID